MNNMNWISVKDRRPEKDALCLVVNEKRPFQYYVSHYSKYFDEFEVWMVGAMIRLPDPVTFNATYWIEIPLISKQLDAITRTSKI